jgi:hypothetical protein
MWLLPGHKERIMAVWHLEAMRAALLMLLQETLSIYSSAVLERCTAQAEQVAIMVAAQANTAAGEELRTLE